MVTETMHQETRGLMGQLFDRFRAAAGWTFRGQRNVDEALGYNDYLQNQDYYNRYQRGGIAGRIVDSMPLATWRGEVKLKEDADEETETPFEKAWNDVARRLQIRAKLQRTDILSRISTFSVLLIGAAGNLNEELPKVAGGNGKLLYLTPFLGGGGQRTPLRPSTTRQNYGAFCDATVDTWDEDIKSERYGLPLTYRLKRLDLRSAEMTLPVHWSRVLHVAEGCLDNDVFGEPCLMRVWNLLDDLVKVTGGGAEAFWLRANQGLHMNIDKEMRLEEPEKEKLRKDADDYVNGMSRWLRTRGVDVSTLGSDVANFGPQADAIITQIAGAKSIPKRILTGSEMGELASSQDRDNWRDQIIGRQQNYAGPYIMRPLINRLITYGYLPMPTGGLDDYDVVWPHIQTLTEDEKTQVALRMAQTNMSQGETVFTPSEIRKRSYDFTPLDPKDVVPVGRGTKKISDPNDPNAQPGAGDGDVLPKEPAKQKGAEEMRALTFDDEHPRDSAGKFATVEDVKSHLLAHPDNRVVISTMTHQYGPYTAKHVDLFSASKNPQDRGFYVKHGKRSMYVAPGGAQVRFGKVVRKSLEQQEDEMVSVLRAAIEAGNTDVIQQIVGAV